MGRTGFLHLTVPAMFRTWGGPEALTLPANFEPLDTTTRMEAEGFHREAVLQNLFKTFKLVPRDIVQLPVLIELGRFSSRDMENKTFAFQASF